MILLDTCALLWLVGDQEKLSLLATKNITNNAGNLYVSSISAFELSLKYEKGLLKLPFPPMKWFHEALLWHGLTEIAINSDIAIRSTLLPKIHQDPADRLIIATAMENQMAIITADKHIHSYNSHVSLKIIW